MASPQKENGYTAIANEILEHLVIIKISGRELQLLLFVLRKTYGFHKKYDIISLSQFQKYLGLDRTRVCRILKELVARTLLLKSKNGYAFNKNWNEWVVAPVLPGGKDDNLGSGKVVNRVVARTPHTKETITKEIVQKRDSLKKVRKELIEKHILR